MYLVKQTWLKGKSSEEREEIRSLYQGSYRLLVILHNIIDDKINRSLKDSDSWKRYFYPNWSKFQADQAGYRRGLNEIKEMLNE